MLELMGTFLEKDSFYDRLHIVPQVFGVKRGVTCQNSDNISVYMGLISVVLSFLVLANLTALVFDVLYLFTMSVTTGTSFNLGAKNPLTIL